MLIDSLEWLGHAGFRLRAGARTVYVDPYRVVDGPKADVICITHEHYDHFSPRDIAQLSHDETMVVGPAVVAERAPGRVVSLVAGQALEPEAVPGLEILAVAAYNTSKRGSDGCPFHPREAGGLGYQLRVRGERLYHAGDTDVIPEMDSVAGVDVAVLPVSGIYVMTASEAAEAARRIQPRLAVPMHWGEHIGTADDARDFAGRAPVEVRILPPPCQSPVRSAM